MSARLWPFVPVALLALCLGGQAVLVVASRGQRGLSVEPDYYRRALRWDELQAGRRGREGGPR